jgi:antirestriction protein
MTVNPSIYVSCLAAYNEGKSHGKWIELEDLDSEDIQEEITKVLESSPCPNVMRTYHTCLECSHKWVDIKEWKKCLKCTSSELDKINRSSSEEYAIHDYEDLPTSLGEHPSLEELVTLTALVIEHEDLANKVYDYSCDIEQCKTYLEECYQGSYKDLEEYAYQYCEDTGMLSECSDNLKFYIDYKRMGRDFKLSGDIFTIECNGEVHVFNNN